LQTELETNLNGFLKNCGGGGGGGGGGLKQ